MTWEKFKIGIKAIGWRTWMKIFMPLFFFVIFPIIALTIIGVRSHYPANFSLIDRATDAITAFGIVGAPILVGLLILKWISDFLDS
mgnify:CR=1 FL=1